MNRVSTVLENPGKSLNWKKNPGLNEPTLYMLQRFRKKQRHRRLSFVKNTVVYQDMVVWKPGTFQSYKIEELCLMLNCTSPCTNPLSQLY